MSIKTLRAIASVIWEEVERNADFAARLENALGSFATDFDRRRKIQLAAKSLSLSLGSEPDAAGNFRKKVTKLTTDALREVIALNNLDPSGSVPGNASKARLIDIVVEGATKRSKRKNAFDY